ncbi:alpha/beta hydrolase domain-containing protein [Nocardia sp. NPDC059246]|uniref:alpha/beta hydrolase domain-containing protein n=1 Tax=unclassified Nocardia TaxID=2637762 RepID=UPI00369299D4
MELSGPVAGPFSLISTFFSLPDVGYVAEEYFLSGTAASYRLTGSAGNDGEWATEPGRLAPFTTRLVVYRPIEGYRGTAVVEWLNASSGADTPPIWLLAHRHLIRARMAWIGVSTQYAPIHGGGGMAERDDSWNSVRRPPLKQSDPVRYADLSHPGDAYCYDIYRQAGELVRRLVPGTQQVLAAGQSQSAAMLVTYVNAIAPHGSPYDAYLIDGRPGRPATLTGRVGAVALNGGTRVRADSTAPVLALQTETDVVGFMRSIDSRQPDSDYFRLWELAGAAHVDSYSVGASFTDSGTLTAAELAERMAPRRNPLGVDFPEPINSGPQHHYVLQRAIAALSEWADGGPAPARADRLRVSAGELVLDVHGNALGGVRTPWLDVPLAVLSGLGQEGGGPAIMFGCTRPLPGPTPDNYLEAFRAATGGAVAAGFLLAEDVPEILAMAVANQALSNQGRIPPATTDQVGQGART